MTERHPGIVLQPERAIDTFSPMLGARDSRQRPTIRSRADDPETAGDAPCAHAGGCMPMREGPDGRGRGVPCRDRRTIIGIAAGSAALGSVRERQLPSPDRPSKEAERLQAGGHGPCRPAGASPGKEHTRPGSCPDQFRAGDSAKSGQQLTPDNCCYRESICQCPKSRRPGSPRNPGRAPPEPTPRRKFLLSGRDVGSPGRRHHVPGPRSRPRRRTDSRSAIRPSAVPTGGVLSNARTPAPIGQRPDAVRSGRQPRCCRRASCAAPLRVARMRSP